LFKSTVVAVRTHGARDQVVGDVFEIAYGLLVYLGELRPDRPIERLFASAHHNCRLPSPRIPVRVQAVFAAERDEQPDRSRVVQRELQFDFGIMVPVRTA